MRSLLIFMLLDYLHPQEIVISVQCLYCRRCYLTKLCVLILMCTKLSIHISYACIVDHYLHQSMPGLCHGRPASYRSAASQKQVIAGRVILGLGIGLASVTAPVYIAETAPAPVRATLVTFNTLMITCGQLAAYFLSYLFTFTHSTWRYAQYGSTLFH